MRRIALAVTRAWPCWPRPPRRPTSASTPTSARSAPSRRWTSGCPTRWRRPTRSNSAVQFPPGFLDVSPNTCRAGASTCRPASSPSRYRPTTAKSPNRCARSSGPGRAKREDSARAVPRLLDLDRDPGKAGEGLTFKILQYYDNGEVVRWIGSPDSETRHRRSTSPPKARRCRTSPVARPHRRARRERRRRADERPARARMTAPARASRSRPSPSARSG